MPSVRDRLERLTFQMQAPQLLYLNRDRVDTLFVARLGAIKGLRAFRLDRNRQSTGALGRAQGELCCG
jgi:hypothetical protein